MEDPLQKECYPSSPKQPTKKPWVYHLAWCVTTEPGRQWFPLIQPPWLSLSCVCLGFPSTEPSIFPLSIFSPGTLDHPGIQSWTEVSETVWHTPGLALRSVSFWRWFQRMGCATFWGLTSLSGGLAGQLLSLCLPSSPSAHLPPPPLPLSTPLWAPLPNHCMLFPLPGWHCPSITVTCGFLSL